jgi:hypothetical protein
VFSYEELRQRRAIMGFTFATLLIPYKIKKYNKPSTSATIATTSAHHTT